MADINRIGMADRDMELVDALLATVNASVREVAAPISEAITPRRDLMDISDDESKIQSTG
jgi:hypothetical protein